MPPPPDPDFVAFQQAVRDGNQQAQTALYERFGPAVHALFSKLLDSRAPRLRRFHDSEDFKQDVLLECFTKLRLQGIIFAHPKQLEVFLDKLAHSHFIDFLRHFRRQRFNFLVHHLSLDDPSLDDHPRLVSRQPSPSEVLEADEFLKELVEDMPIHHQRVLTLKANGYTTAEIAVKLEMSQSWVYRIVQIVRDQAAVSESSPVTIPPSSTESSFP